MSIKQVTNSLFTHSATIISNRYKNIIFVACDVDVNMECSFIFHGVPHCILNNGLNQKRRDLNVFASLINMLRLLDTFFSKTGFFNCQIPACLCQFLRKRNERALRTLKCATIKHRKLTKQVSCLIRICTRKRCNGIERIKQEMWINLSLQGFDLGPSGQFCLTIKFVR